MKTATRSSAKPRALKTTEDVAFIVEGAMKLEGYTINRLAESAGVCFATVARLIARETKFPRLDTVTKILAALDYEVSVSKRNGVSVKDLA